MERASTTKPTLNVVTIAPSRRIHPCPGLALGNAFYFGRMQRIQLVLALALWQGDFVQMTFDKAFNWPHS